MAIIAFGEGPAEGMSTTTKYALGAAALVAVGAVAWAMMKKPAALKANKRRKHRRMHANKPYSVYKTHEKLVHHDIPTVTRAVSLARKMGKKSKVVVYDAGRHDTGHHGRFVAMFRPNAKAKTKHGYRNKFGEWISTPPPGKGWADVIKRHDEIAFRGHDGRLHKAFINLVYAGVPAGDSAFVYYKEGRGPESVTEKQTISVTRKGKRVWPLSSVRRNGKTSAPKRVYGPVECGVCGATRPANIRACGMCGSTISARQRMADALTAEWLRSVRRNGAVKRAPGWQKKLYRGAPTKFRGVAPKKYQQYGAIERSHYAFPEAFKYPIHGKDVATTKRFIRTAASRYAKFKGRIAPEFREAVGRRIEAAKKKYGIGEYNPKYARKTAVKRARKVA